jgi:hypothetical protein
MRALRRGLLGPFGRYLARAIAVVGLVIWLTGGSHVVSACFAPVYPFTCNGYDTCACWDDAPGGYTSCEPADFCGQYDCFLGTPTCHP